MSSTRSKLAIAAVLIAVIVAIWKWPRASAAHEPEPAAKPRTTEAYVPAAPAVGPDHANTEPPGVEALEKALADYKAGSVYPPWSRPLGEETADKLRWNQTVVSDLPMDDRDGKDVIYHFGADRWTVPYDEPFVSWIEVLDHGKRIPVRVLEANIMSGDGGRAGTVAFHDDGLDGDATAGDLRYSSRFVPAKSATLDAGMQAIEGVMFGRAVVEKGADGPYIVQDIRAMRRFIDTDEQNFYFTYPQKLQTQPYKHTQFSNAEWDAQEKRDTIANFERSIDETRAGGGGTAHPTPTIDPAQDPAVFTTPPTKPHP